MRPSYIFISTYVIAISVVTIVGCNKDEVYDDCYENLEVTNHTSLTRSSAYDGFEISQTTDYASRNKKYPKEENGCYLTVIMEEWIKSRAPGYFDNPQCHPNAAEYYDDLKRRLMQSNPNWNVGDSLFNSQFNAFVQNNCSYLVGTITFAEMGMSASSYFSDPSNNSKTSAILVRNISQNKGHMAPFIKYKSPYVNFSGEDFLENGKYKINVNGEAGWEIYGVVKRP